mgnify:CR=1 FL=1
METRIVLTEHSREVAEPGVQWVQQYSPIISGIEVKPVTTYPHDFQTFLRPFSGHWLGSPSQNLGTVIGICQYVLFSAFRERTLIKFCLFLFCQYLRLSALEA